MPSYTRNKSSVKTKLFVLFASHSVVLFCSTHFHEVPYVDTIELFLRVPVYDFYLSGELLGLLKT